MTEEYSQSKNSVNEEIRNHYIRKNLKDVVLLSLQKSGKDINRLTYEDLAPIDQFHTQGIKSTIDLAQHVTVESDYHVLDAGSGIGGPARYLAFKFGCKVTGLDLLDEYCEVAEVLTKKIGLDTLVNFRQGDATRMPFGNAMFDLLWTQHASMNIANKTQFYSEMHRVLKCSENAGDRRGQGKLVIYDIYKGNNYDETSFHFPVPWASHPSLSFLIYPEDALEILHDAGFKEIIWDDKTEDALKWFREMTERFREDGGASRQLGLELIVGPKWQTMVKNLLENYEEGNIVLVQGVFKCKE